jgi:hypothetical protein
VVPLLFSEKAHIGRLEVPIVSVLSFLLLAVFDVIAGTCLAIQAAVNAHLGKLGARGCC